MGSVFLCHHVEDPTHRRAIKLILDPSGAESKNRFLREAEVLFALRHPAVVRVFDVSGEADFPYLLMEYVEGETLASRLLRGPLPCAEACRVLGRVADGIQHAHELGIRHRDIKPGNIMLCADGGVRLLDFGIAMVEGRTSFTGAGKAVGTVRYMPPEILSRARPDGIRWDIYSLGVVLYEALTGEVSFRDPPVEPANRRWIMLLQSKQVHPPLDPGPRFPQTLRNLVRRSTEPNPELRLHEASAFVTVLEWVARSIDGEGNAREYLASAGPERASGSNGAESPLLDSGPLLARDPTSLGGEQEISTKVPLLSLPSALGLPSGPRTMPREGALARRLRAWRSTLELVVGAVLFGGLSATLALWWASR
jgi:serine/threonine protein kinase